MIADEGKLKAADWIQCNLNTFSHQQLMFWANKMKKTKHTHIISAFLWGNVCVWCTWFHFSFYDLNSIGFPYIARAEHKFRP